MNGVTKELADRSPSIRLAIFGLSVAIAGTLVYGPMRDLMANAERGEYYSHILLIPFVTAYFLFEQRGNILNKARYGPAGAAVCGGLGICVCLMAFWFKSFLGPNDFASLATAGSIIFWWGGFLLAFGHEAFRLVRFPLLFMLFMIPVPHFILDRLIYVLQVGSTEVTQWFFELTGTNYIRDGFVYQLPGINIEVAKECSSIRSSMALIITGVVAGHLFLRSGWNKVILLIAMLPINKIGRAHV